MDIDKLFKVPKLPAGGRKRKLPETPTPELLKKLKTDASPNSSTKLFNEGKNSITKVTSGEISHESDLAFAPGGDADYFAEEDDEGRFFGGGLTSEQKEILNIFEKAEGPEDEVIDISIIQIRKSLITFERALNKNQDHRSKHPGDPSKFIDSEADLDGAIKGLLFLSQKPSLAYPELVRSGTVSRLVGLLTHENVDIVIDVVELINELGDDDPEVEFESEEEEEAVHALVKSLVENSALELLVDNLSRLDEKEEGDKQGVFQVLGIFENFISIDPAICSHLTTRTNLLDWLLIRIQSNIHDENRSYAAELLSIVLQNEIDKKLLFARKDGIEILLSLLSKYRKRDPVDSEETEFMENIFDSLCSSLTDDAAKKLFVAAEGPDLMILMMKEKLQSKSRSIKVLDYALSGRNSEIVSNAFVDALGLKTLFHAFMGKSSKKRNQSKSDLPNTEDIGHILGIIAALLTNIPLDSRNRIRLMTKFVECEYEKVDKLLEIREFAHKRLKMTEADIDNEKQTIWNSQGEVLDPDLQDNIYIRRLEGGLFILQTVDYILAWLMVEDDGVQAHALQMLDRTNQNLQDILQTLQTILEHIDNNVGDDNNGGSIEVEAKRSRKDILNNLIFVLGNKFVA